MKRLILVLFLLPSVGMAQQEFDEVSYSWFGIGYMGGEVELPGDNLDASGWGMDVSFTVREHIHLFAMYESLSLDDFEDITGREKTFGIGVHFDVADGISLFGRLGYVDVQADTGFGSAEDDGARVIAGGRFLLRQGFEVRAGVDHVELDISGGDTGGFVGGDLWLTDVIALSGSYQFRDDGSAFLVGGRLYFGD